MRLFLKTARLRTGFFKGLQASLCWLGVGSLAKILRQMSSPLVTLYPLGPLERQCEGKVSRELVEGWA